MSGDVAPVARREPAYEILDDTSAGSHGCGGAGPLIDADAAYTYALSVVPALPFPLVQLPLVNVQLLQERERVVERLEQVLVVLDHLAAHVDAKPLLVDVQLIAIEHVS